MSQPSTAISEERWAELLRKVKALSSERQEEILDYIAFILEREDPETWGLTDGDRARMDRHLAGDTSDTLALEDVEGAILRGALDEL